MAVSQDPDHARMILEAKAKREADGDDAAPAPPLATWSSEVDLLAGIMDRLGTLVYLTQAVGGNKKAKPPNPVPRPKSVMAKEERKRRRDEHQKLTARLLGR